MILKEQGASSTDGKSVWDIPAETLELVSGGFGDGRASNGDIADTSVEAPSSLEEA